MSKRHHNPSVTSIISKLGKDSIIYGVSGTIGKIFGFLLLPLITRIFSREQYGIIELVTVFCSFIAVFALAGMNSAQMVYYYDKGINKKDVLIKNTIFFFIWGAILYYSIFLLYPFFFEKFITDLIPKSVIVLGLLSSYLLILNNHFSSIFRLIMKPWKFLSINVLGVIVTYSLLLYFVIYLHTGLDGYFLSKIISSITIIFISIFILKNYINGSFSIDIFKRMLLVGLPLIPTDLGTALINISDRFFINRYLSLDEVGLYGVGVRIASITLLFTYAFRLAWPPIAMSIKEKTNAKYIYTKIRLPFFLLGSIIVIVISGLAKPILVIMTQPDFYDAYKCVGFFAYGIWWASSYFVSGLGLFITKKTKFFSIGILLSGIVGVILNICLIPTYGITGAAFATCIAHFVGNLITNYYSNRYYPLGLSTVNLFLILFVTLFSVGLQLMFFDLNLNLPTLSIAILGTWIISIFILVKFLGNDDIERIKEYIFPIFRLMK